MPGHDSRIRRVMTAAGPGGAAAGHAVLPGAQGWSAAGGDVGVLALHGFTGNPASVRPLAEVLAQAGLAVEAPRLPGHGTHWRELGGTGWHDWLGEADAALARLRARTRVQVAVGVSMGATLALALAATRADGPAGLVLVNPWLINRDPRLALVPVLQHVVPSVAGVGDDIAKPHADEGPYPRIPLRALASALSLQRRVRRRLGRVRVPTLMFTSRHDHVVDPSNGRFVLDRLGTPDTQQVWLEDSFHVATLDYDAELIAARTSAFVDRIVERHAYPREGDHPR